MPLKIHRVCKPFKFFNIWADHPDFIPVVRGVWCKYVKGSPLFRICSKLRSIKPKFKALNKKHFSDISVRTSCAKEDLDRVQFQLDKYLGDSNLQSLERDLCANFAKLCKEKESFATQKSRIQWLSLGDSNSRFFFHSINNNRNRNRISSVTLDDGSIIVDLHDVKSIFVSYFEGFLGKPFVDRYSGGSRVQELIKRKLSPA